MTKISDWWQCDRNTHARRNTRRPGSLIRVIPLIILAGCQTTFPPGYGFFSRPESAVEAAIADGDPREAARIIETLPDYFGSTDEALVELSERVGLHATESIDRLAQGSTADLMDLGPSLGRSRWAQAKSILASAEGLLRENSRYARILEKHYEEPPAVDRLHSVLAGKREELVSKWRASFLKFHRYFARNFFDYYPVALGVDQSIGPELWARRLVGSSDREIVEAHFTYRGRVSKAALPVFQSAFVEFLNPKTVNLGLAEAIQVWSKAVLYADFRGLDLGPVRPSIAVFMKAPPDRASGPSLDVDFDDAIVRRVTSLDSAFDTAISGSVDLVAAIVQTSMTSTRRVENQSQVSSRRVVGTRVETNPRYLEVQNGLDLAKLDLSRSQMELNRVSGIYCEGLVCIAKIVALTKARNWGNAALKNVHDWSGLLSSTPLNIEVPVLEPYSYRVVDVEVSRGATFVVEIFDRNRGAVYRDSVDLSESATLHVPYGLDPNDPDSDRIRRQRSTESDLDEYEVGSFALTATDIVSDAVSKPQQVRATEKQAVNRLKAVAATDMTVGRNANDRLVASNLSSRPSDDSRSRHVVVIESPDGSLGTGFFVAPNRILTNQHVVGASGFVVIRDQTGAEGIGRVLKSDLMRDLALLSSDLEGTPVALRTEMNLRPGSTVEVIGHPRGLEYSLTRGIVSAVRMMTSEVGGGEIMSIQTDAAISPGNSGGPLFLGKEVVGICTWKQVGRGTEGLGFAVHVSEIVAFLD